MAKTGFSKPRLHDRKGNIKNDWFVSFYFTHPVTRERKPFPLRRGLNYLHTKAERHAYGNALCDIVEKALKKGWNPYDESLEVFECRITEPPPEATPGIAIKYTPDGCLDIGAMDITGIDFSALTLPQALDFCLASKKPSLRPKSYTSYRVVKDFAKVAAVNSNIDKVPIKDIKRAHIKFLLDQMQKDRIEAYQVEYDRRLATQQNRHGTYKVKKVTLQKFTGNSYNKYKQYLHILFSELEEYDALEYNPCSKISDRPEIKTNIHRHATEAEEQEIKNTLKERHIHAYVFLAFIELCGLRPVEILALQISDIDKFNQSLNVFPEGVKTREGRKVPIPNAMLPLLNLLRLVAYPSNYYIFSVGLQPGERMIQRDKATKSWNKIVKRDLGLDVSMYSFKGLGGEKKREAGINKETVSKQYGHTNVRTTEIYLHGEQERGRRDIIENTPAFQ